MNNDENNSALQASTNENDQLFIAIEKYFLLMILEFQEHLSKYKNLYLNMCTNTDEYFTLFEQMVGDYCNEINMNQTAFYDMISKFNAISEQLPILEEFYYKVKEMRLGLEKMSKLVKK